ncbi:caspase family protein [Seonamhaeicola sp. S2-3]|uniref:caspase family protein n=1 Tax=Seonamhaeicola sp. S2-3 TaxID=1936081 RepID=UPI0012F97E89|nr:caspase family protein [Seonamhaeicola sp. S2-3]
MRYLKITFAFLFNIIAMLSFSQVNNNISVSLKDYHAASLTEIISTEDGKYFISADNSGKILMYNTSNYSYHKTLRKASGIPIENMRLLKHDSLLLFNQKHMFSDGKTDSLIGIRLYDNKVILKKNLSGSFIGKQEDIIIAKSKNQYLYILEVFDKNFKKITAAYPKNNVEIAATNKNHFTIAYVENKLSIQQNLVVINTKTAEEIINLPVPETQVIIHLFFDNNTDELFSVNTDTKNNKTHIYNLSKNPEFTNPVFSIENILGRFTNVNTFNTESAYHIAISSNSTLPYNPILIKKEHGKFSAEIPKTKNGTTQCLLIKQKNEYVFFEPFNANFNSINSFSVYDIDSKVFTKQVPKESVKFYSGTFLPNNNWMVMGNELQKNLLTSYEHQIKYFETGTFNNRFNKLDFTNYLEAKHSTVEFTNTTFNINKLTGIHPFYGYKKLDEYNQDYGFYTYDFIKDKVEKIAEENRNYTTILDYNNSKNLLLLSKRLYSNGGHTEPQEFVLLSNNKLNVLKGKYKFGKLSNNGDFLLTINSENLAEIQEIKTQKVVFSTPLIDGKFKLFSIENNSFIISNSYYELDINKCNKESVIIEFDAATSKYKSQKTDCVYITDVAYANDNVAMIADGFGLLFNKKTLQFHQSEFPIRVSLNQKGDKLMITFSNGKISIYNTNTLKEIGVMIHPNKNTHAFIDSNGYFFSNVNSEDFFTAYKDNKVIPIDEAETLYFNPEKVLNIFGTPNMQYVNALKKALNIKAKNQQNSTEIKRSKAEKNLLPPELYVLSIGVSEYQQADFNLTFADKDAFDIAKIYGELPKKDMFEYKTKFFGNQFSLFNANEPVKSVNKYFGNYKGAGNLYAVSADRTIWLEENNDDFFLWDFNKKTTEKLNVPKGFKMPFVATNKVVFINPDNSGFYIIDKNNDYYQFTFSSKQLKKIKLPFTQIKGAPKLTVNNNWVQFSSKFNGSNNYGILEIGKTNKSVSNTIKFKIDVVEVFENGQKTFDTVYGTVPQFKAISNNGNYLIYADYIDLFWVDLTNNAPTPVKLNIKKTFDYNTEFFISNDGETISFLNVDTLKNYKVETYNLEGILKDSVVVNNAFAFSWFNNIPFWIKSTPPLVEEDLFDSNELLEKNAPFSFKQTHIKHIINANATNNNIKLALIKFLKKAKSNDQIIVFLAGHGVLDKDLNYYFAPHDMDFNNVTKKGVSLNTIIESLNKSNSKNILLLIDSCHSGNTLDIETSEIDVIHTNSNNERGSKSRKTSKNSKFKVSEIISSLFKDFLSTSGITIISASSGEDVAYENKELGNGAFTSAYIKLLKKELNGNGLFIDEKDLQKSIHITPENIEELLKDVMITTNGKQVPDLRELNPNSNLKMW